MNVGVRAHGVPGVHGEHPAADRQAPQQRLELGDLVGLGPHQSFGDHRGVVVGGGGQQVRDHAVGPDRVTHRLAVHGEGRQQHGPGDRGAHRGDAGPLGEVGAQMVGQVLRAQRGEDPLDRVRMRRLAASAAIPPTTQRGQQILWRTGDPVGDLGQGHTPGQHRRGAQAQNRW